MQGLRLQLPRWVALMAATLAVGCAAEEPVTRPNPVDPQVIAQSRKDFAASLQEARKTSIKVKDQAALLMTALDRLVDPKQADLRSSYDSYTKSLATLDSDAESMKRAAGKVHSDGPKFLSYWEQDLASYVDEDLREDGESRRSEVAEAFTETESGLNQALGAVAGLHVLTGDVKKFLDNTLSVEGVEQISGVTDEAHDGCERVGELIDAATEAIDHLIKELPS